jgi:hypothetical protein
MIIDKPTNQTDIEKILEQIRQNSVLLSKQHKINYLDLKSSLKYYRLPVIVISALNSAFSIGLQPFINQTTISLINCGLALAVGMIGSIEIFYGITKKMELELTSSKDYYVLSADIYKFLSLEKQNRTLSDSLFLDDVYGRYINLIETSSILKKTIKDGIANVPEIICNQNYSDNISNENIKYINNNNINKGITDIEANCQGDFQNGDENNTYPMMV